MFSGGKERDQWHEMNKSKARSNEYILSGFTNK